MKEFKVFKCKVCGNVIVKMLDMGPAVSCCGQEMQELKAGTTDAALEKHVPEVSRKGNTLEVQVGSVIHPMTEDHWITFIAAVQGEKLQVVYLNPEDEPKACFQVEDGPVEVYEYCNLHGLWKAEA
ncbi:MAG: desulfoferrodoxin family protein [Eubacteriales bacterium]|nr:desulfoferrodoxin family protein [Clostridiales bacterium]MDY5836593.1 desulfoferrodoxin family protein [Eubacteriales bacterium]